MMYQAEPAKPMQHSDGPVISGGNVIAIKYDKGILIGADTMLKYAGCYWYKGMSRLNKVSDNVIIGSSGDYADLQQMLKKLKDKHDLDCISEDYQEFLGPKDYLKWLAAVQFNKRMRVDPFWNSHIVAGIDKETGEKYLGTVDIHGNNYEGNYLCTGIAAYFCKRILSEGVTEETTFEQAKEIINKCFTTLYYRDKFQSDNIELVTIEDGPNVTFHDPYTLESEWSYGFTVNKTNDQTRDMRYPTQA